MGTPLVKKALSWPWVYRTCIPPGIIGTVCTNDISWAGKTRLNFCFSCFTIHASFKMTERLVLVLLLDFASKFEVILLLSHTH